MNDSNNNTSIFRGGLPYAPDVLRLEEEIPLARLSEGTVIGHDAFERALGYKRGTQRYYSVVNAWMAKNRNAHGLNMAWEPTKGVRVLNPAELLSVAEARTRQKMTQTSRAIRLFGWVDRGRLDDTGKKRLDHQLRVASVLKQAIQEGRREMAVELAPIKCLPKRAI